MCLGETWYVYRSNLSNYSFSSYLRTYRRAYNRRFYQIANLPAFTSHFRQRMTQSKNHFLLQLSSEAEGFVSHIQQ
jgi:hypothetical protein